MRCGGQNRPLRGAKSAVRGAKSAMRGAELANHPHAVPGGKIGHFPGGGIGGYKLGRGQKALVRPPQIMQLGFMADSLAHSCH